MKKIIHYALILDKSGSMKRIEEEVVSSFIEQIEGIKKLKKSNPDSEIKFTLCTFNDIFLISVIILSSCNEDSTPYSGVYVSNNADIYAIVIDSSLCLMTEPDTAYFYDLHFINEIFIPEIMNEDEKMYIMGLTYSNSFNRLGAVEFASSFDFETDKNYGNTVVAIFEGNSSMTVGGILYDKPGNEEMSNKILNAYKDLLVNNLQFKYSK